MTVRDNIESGKYENTVPYSRKSEPITDDMTIKQAREHEKRQKELKREQRKLYFAEESRLGNLFRQDLEEEFGMAGHPKASRLFSLACEFGYSSGYEDVVSYYEELVELVK